jgi:small nuclear ribonucleoprotein (snRNP)-like protein
MSVNEYLKNWIGSGSVIVHLTNGKELPGVLSALEDMPMLYQVEVVQGQTTTTTAFNGEDVVAITLPSGQRGKKRR